MLYGGWLTRIAARFQARIEAIPAPECNFDYGPEFECALCEVLRELLPRRVGVCRGYVVAQNGEKAGDDIVIFDASRFPTLRALGEDLSLKEEVPAEAVLAYIEAKHTLDLEGEGGQSLAKACDQVAAVKRLPRDPVQFSQVLNGVNLGGDGVKVSPPPGSPDRLNPWYAAVWARYLRPVDAPASGAAFMQSVADLVQTSTAFPDVIAAERSIAMPFLLLRNEGGEAKQMVTTPFLCDATELMPGTTDCGAMGLAAMHLVTAIERIRLGDIPWGRMISEQIVPSRFAHGTPPLRPGHVRSKP